LPLPSLVGKVVVGRGGVGLLICSMLFKVLVLLLAGGGARAKWRGSFLMSSFSSFHTPYDIRLCHVTPLSLPLLVGSRAVPSTFFMLVLVFILAAAPPLVRACGPAVAAMFRVPSASAGLPTPLDPQWWVVREGCLQRDHMCAQTPVPFPALTANCHVQDRALGDECR